MKKIHLFWKVMLVVLPLSTTALFGLLSWNLYHRLYGESNHTETYSRGLEKIYYRNGTVRVMNTQTRKFTTPRLRWIANYDGSDSLIVFCCKCRRGYMSLYNGEIVIPAQYQSAWMFSEGLGAVIKENKIGFIDSQGKEVIPFQFRVNPLPGRRVDFLFKKGLCPILNTRGKVGLINKKGEWVLQPEYDNITSPGQGYRVVSKGGKSGLLDSLLHQVLPFEYDTIVIATDGLIVARGGLQQKLAFDAQTIVNPFLYDEVSDIYYHSGKVNEEGDDIQVKSDYMAFKINGKAGLLDKNGKVVLTAKFDDIAALSNDLFTCTIGGYQITMNAGGQEVQ